MSIIEFKGLTKAYKDVVAVKDLTASIEAGRITGFLGPMALERAPLLNAYCL